jgi:beta-1,4-mannosyltransferase
LSPDRSRMRIASVPSPSSWNPYSELLYEQLARHGFGVTRDGRLSISWLWSARREVRFLHFQWPESLYQRRHGPRVLRLPLSWLKLPLFVARLLVARALGYRLVWTIHQVYPHETMSRRIDRIAARTLGRLAHLLIAHDDVSAARARAALGDTCEIEIVPHGSYVGVYPPGRPKEVVRGELGISNDAFVFLSFGHLREYKDVDILLDAFGSASLPPAALVIAGPTVRAEQLELLLAERAAADPRIKLLLRFVPVEQVAELFDSVDVAVLPRGDGGTSGSLVLALSLATPVIAADTPNYRTLTADGAAGWFFTPGDEVSMRTALEQAAADPSEAQRRREVALASTKPLSWPHIAERFSRLLKSIA